MEQSYVICHLSCELEIIQYSNLKYDRLPSQTLST